MPPAGFTLRIRAVKATHAGHDDIELGVHAHGQEHSFGTFDGRYLSTEVAGGFTGRVVGTAATRGEIHRMRATYKADG